MNYEAMTDRELDALVAEKVMGDTLCRDPDCEGCDNWTPENVGSFSTNPQLAFLAVEKMIERGWMFEATSPDPNDTEDTEWMCVFTFMRTTGGGIVAHGENYSLPRAICIAALRACE